MGDRARGLQRRRRRVALLLPRPGALARLPLGRGRHRGRLRRPPAPLPLARAVERRGPDPQGADVRPHERRGQPRRGRQGVLVLPRQHAHALVPEVPVQVPAASVPVRGPHRHERPAEQDRVRVRAARHGRLRRGPLLRRRRRVRQGRARRRADARHRPQPRPGRGDAAPAPDAVVPQHVVVGRRRREAAPRGARRDRRPRDPPRHRRLDAVRRRFGRPPVLRERDEQRAPVRRAERVAVRQGRDQRRGRRGRRGRGQPGAHRDEGRRPPRPAHRGGRERVGPGAPHRRGQRRRRRRRTARGRTSTRCSPPAATRPTASTRR